MTVAVPMLTGVLTSLSIADDLGHNDVGWANERTITPSLDSLVAGGVELMQFYVFKYCVRREWTRSVPAHHDVHAAQSSHPLTHPPATHPLSRDLIGTRAVISHTHAHALALQHCPQHHINCHRGKPGACVVCDLQRTYPSWRLSCPPLNDVNMPPPRFSPRHQRAALS